MSEGADGRSKASGTVKSAQAKPSAQPRARAKDATNGETIAAPRSPVTVPEVPATPARGASAARLGILTTTLALMIGGLAWFSEMPELPGSEAFQIAFGAPATPALPTPPAEAPASEPLPSQARLSLEQELNIAVMKLEIREGQESLARLRDDARALAVTVGALASGMQSLKEEVNVGLARVEDRLHNTVTAAAAPAPIPLGDPALREAAPTIAAKATDATFAGAEPALVRSEASEQPVTTGGLPDREIAAPPQASVEVNFAKPQQARSKAPKPLAGWAVRHGREDLALVEGAGAHYEVRPGEELPGAGVVRAIKKRGERWVVLTSKGVISEPR